MKKIKQYSRFLFYTLFTVITMHLLILSSNALALTTIFEETGRYAIFSKGVGLNSGSGATGNIEMNISGTPVKAYLYWIERDFKSPPGVDDTITFTKGFITEEIKGDQIGSEVDSYCFRAEITEYVTSGENSFTLSGLDNERNPGAGILVVAMNEMFPLSKIEIKEGCDFFYWGTSGHRNSEMIIFDVSPSSLVRAGRVTFFVGDAQTETGGCIRANKVLYRLSYGNITLGKDKKGLVDNDGYSWDTFGRNSGVTPTISVPASPYDDPDLRGVINIPAGDDKVRFQILSPSPSSSPPWTCVNGVNPNGISAILSTAAFQTILESQGCTPGYWKQPQHFDSWSIYSPGTKFYDVFKRTITIKWNDNGKPLNVTNPTLLQALDANGGGINALARHVVAALLNALSPFVFSDPAFDTPYEVIKAFQGAYNSGNYETLKNLLEASNEAGCPLN